MKLQEQFENAKEVYNLDFEVVKNYESIADQFAIEFTEWCDNNYFRMGNTHFWSASLNRDDNVKYQTKELLEIFKKEKQL